MNIKKYMNYFLSNHIKYNFWTFMTNQRSAESSFRSFFPTLLSLPLPFFLFAAVILPPFSHPTILGDPTFLRCIEERGRRKRERREDDHALKTRRTAERVSDSIEARLGLRLLFYFHFKHCFEVIVSRYHSEFHLRVFPNQLGHFSASALMH